MLYMKKIKTSEFRQNMYKYLEELPLELYKRNEVVGYVVQDNPEDPIMPTEKSDRPYAPVLKEKIEEGWKEIKTKEDVIKEVPFKMPHKFGGMKK